MEREKALKVLAGVSFILMAGQAQNWLVQCVWSVAWLTVFMVSVSALERSK